MEDIKQTFAHRGRNANASIAPERLCARVENAEKGSKSIALQNRLSSDRYEWRSDVSILFFAVNTYRYDPDWSSADRLIGDRRCLYECSRLAGTAIRIHRRRQPSGHGCPDLRQRPDDSMIE